MRKFKGKDILWDHLEFLDKSEVHLLHGIG